MQERVTSIGGSLIVHAAPGRGTRIVVKIDLESQDEVPSA